MSTVEAPGIDREIYPMPMFVTLAVRDLVASSAWYEAAGFVVLATLPGPAGPSSLVHLRRMRHQDLLLVPGEPATGPRITFAAGDDDLDERARLTGHAEGPVDTPWYTRDLVLTDPDGHTLVLTSWRQADSEAHPEWVESVRSSVGRRPE